MLVRTGPIVSGGRPVVTAQVQGVDRHRALSGEAAAALASAAALALERRLPLVTWFSSPGLDLQAGVAALDGWGRVAQAFARCSGGVPIVAVVSGPVLSGPALLLGMVDAAVMTPGALIYLSGRPPSRRSPASRSGPTTSVARRSTPAAPASPLSS